jgi:hypothetical protein
MAASKKISILRLSATPLLMVLASPVLAQGISQGTSPSQPANPHPAQSTTQGPAVPPAPAGPQVDTHQVNTLQEAFARLFSCWKPPSATEATPMDITVMVSFNRSGAIMGRPRITYESPKATDSDRFAYRVAVMKALQRCSPMPFTEAMAGAVAGRPLTLLLRTHLQPQEKRAWLSPKTL